MAAFVVLGIARIEDADRAVDSVERLELDDDKVREVPDTHTAGWAVEGHTLAADTADSVVDILRTN